VQRQQERWKPGVAPGEAQVLAKKVGQGFAKEKVQQPAKELVRQPVLLVAD